MRTYPNRRRRFRTLIPFLLAISLSVVVAACSDEQQPAAGEPTVQANVATGRVTGPRGEVLAGAVITIRGTSLESGERSRFRIATGDDGRYRIELPPGQYEVAAKYSVDFDGRVYDFTLHPTDDDPDRTHDSRNGFRKDFVWRLAGLVPGRESSRDEHFAHYGGAIDISMSVDGGWQNPEPLVPAGTRVTVRLTPQGPLVDGSQGEPLQFETQFTGTPKYISGKLLDIPVGVYTVVAEAALPDDRKQPLMVEVRYAKAAPSLTATLQFEPDPSSKPGVKQRSIMLTLPQ